MSNEGRAPAPAGIHMVDAEDPQGASDALAKAAALLALVATQDKQAQD